MPRPLHSPMRCTSTWKHNFRWLVVAKIVRRPPETLDKVYQVLFNSRNTPRMVAVVLPKLNTE